MRDGAPVVPGTEHATGPVHDKPAHVLAERLEADSHGRERAALELKRRGGVRRHVDGKALAGARAYSDERVGLALSAEDLASLPPVPSLFAGLESVEVVEVASEELLSAELFCSRWRFFVP